MAGALENIFVIMYYRYDLNCLKKMINSTHKICVKNNAKAITYRVMGSGVSKGGVRGNPLSREMSIKLKTN